MPSVINKGHFPLPFYIVKNEKHAQSTQATRGPRKSITLDETKNVINFTLCDAPIQPAAGPNSPHTPRPQEICLKMLQDKETKAINKRTKKILAFWTLYQCNLVSSSTLLQSSSTETFIVLEISSIRLRLRSRNDSIKSPSRKFLASTVFFSLLKDLHCS